ncbi:DUF3109 family protein [Prolixibacteraceae bacterium Z1-6]|uniref:DUF3109 family protein n=1 Tax=Draconibacterium aestuarii TaxID=2998507 RepID=A0A9X3J734_9BACT|nr:DUF3109 family protein [Prolixibacteraceae bacterium Z1-6]
MVEIGRAIISNDIFEKHFLCDILKCKGACCIEGDSGAPLTDEEAILIEQEYDTFADLLPQKHKNEVEKQGYSLIDEDGDLVTPLVNNRQCVYSYYNDKGILKCAIEKANFDGKTKFRKPISCHLFPIRITEYKRFDAVNYQELNICKPGRECGASEKLPLYKFLKVPLIKKYGEEWYREVEIAAEHLLTSR